MRRTTAASGSLISRLTCERSAAPVHVLAGVHVDVAIPEHAATDTVALPGPLGVSLVHALARLLPVQLVAEALQRTHGLIHGVARSQAPTVHVLEDFDAGLRQRLNRHLRFVRFAADRLLLRDDEHVEGCARLQCRQQALVARPSIELGATDPVVLEDIRRVHRPALRLREGAGKILLPRDALLRFSNAGLLGALASVDGCDHGSPTFAYWSAPDRSEPCRRFQTLDDEYFGTIIALRAEVAAHPGYTGLAGIRVARTGAPAVFAVARSAVHARDRRAISRGL